VIDVPERLGWWSEFPGGANWLESLPRLAAESAERWGLRLGRPFGDGFTSLVLPVERADGSGAVLKLTAPHAASEHEADALAYWDGRGAVRLLAHDRERRALLLERCEPGDLLWSVAGDEEATRIAAGVLRELWRPPAHDHPFSSLTTAALRLAAELESALPAVARPDRALVEDTVAFLREPAPGARSEVVLHEDFQGANVLLSRRGWIAIDPAPLVGEREFDAGSLLRDRRWHLVEPGPGARLRRRLDLLTAELDLDRGRTRAWGIAHALRWGLGIGEADMVECARLLARA
jgi:streptomycin 6-kinase